MSSPAEEPRVAPASDYDTFVNWDARLGRELPFFERLFAEADAHSLIDVGAGSARHAIAFAESGHDRGRRRPRRLHARSGRAQRGRRGRAGSLPAAVSCGSCAAASASWPREGSALPTRSPAPATRCRTSPASRGCGEALADFHAVLRPGGVLVLHLLNHARLLGAKPRVIPPIIREVPEGTRVFLRVIDYPASGEFLDFDFVTLTRDAEGAWDVASRRSPHTALPIELLVAELDGRGIRAHRGLRRSRRTRRSKRVPTRASSWWRAARPSGLRPPRGPADSCGTSAAVARSDG